MANLFNDPSLKAYYRMESNSADSSPNNANTGTDTSMTYVTGNFGNAGTFDSLNSFITISNHISIQDLFATGGSISAWIYTDSDGENSVGRIADKMEDSTTVGWYFSVALEAAGVVKLRFAQEFSTTHGEWNTTSTEVSNGVWTHVVVTYDASGVSNNPTIYVGGLSKGVSETSTPVGTFGGDSAKVLTIGNRGTNPNVNFDGEIDDICFFNRILTQAEITDLSTKELFTLKSAGKVMIF